MGATPDEPIRLTKSQTEMLTRALAEAAQQAALPKSSETEVIQRPAPKPAPPVAKPPKKTTII